MATTMMAVTARPATTQFQPLSEVHVKANSPYGLPIVDNCVKCPLRTSNSFCALSQRSVEDLDQLKHSTSYPEGALVFTEGQAARGVYILCQGRAKVLATNSDGKTLIVKIAQPGEILGVHSAVSGKPHEFTVETLQPSQLAFVRRDDFLRFIKEHGDACLQAAAHLSRDCQSAYEVIRAIGLAHSASEKLARLLLQWSADGKAIEGGAIRVKLALTHEEIAQLIGTSRETVTRILGDFKRHHVAELTGSTLLVHNKQALEKSALS